MMLQLSQEYREMFQEMGYSAFVYFAPPLSTEKKGTFSEMQIIAYVPDSEVYLTMAVENLQTSTSLEFHFKDFPLIRLVTEILNVPAMPETPLRIEVFFNPLDTQDVEAFKNLAYQNEFQLHLFDDELKNAYTVKIPWSAQNEVKDTWTKAQALLSGKTNDDFYKARERFIKNTTR